MTPSPTPAKPAAASARRDALDRILFESFPGGAADPARFERALPEFGRALREGIPIDVELLFVRLVEASVRASRLVGEDLVAGVRERTLAAGFGPEDSLAAARFLARVLPAEDDALDRLFQDEALEGLQFAMSLDFVLDSREAEEYAALSYLRDGDPDAAASLRGFPIPETARRAWAAFFDRTRCLERLRRGWLRWTAPEERARLAEWVRKRSPEFEPRGSSGAAAQT